jgi:hypothetical protein
MTAQENDEDILLPVPGQNGDDLIDEIMEMEEELLPPELSHLETVEALIAALHTTRDMARQHLQDKTDNNYCVSVIPDAGAIIDREFAKVDDAVDFIRGFFGQAVDVRVFYGKRCKTTKMPYPFLQTTEGNFPLFTGRGISEDIDDSGSLSHVPVRPTLQPVVEEPPPNEPLDEDDLEEEDLEDEDDYDENDDE